MQTGRVIGCLGEVTFVVSAEVVKTIRSLSISYSANIQNHKRRLQKPLLEFVAPEADTASFSLRLSYFLGVDPEKDLNKLKEYLAKGTPKPFVLGEERIGSGLWCITKLKSDIEHYDKAGNIIGIDLSISITEYTRS